MAYTFKRLDHIQLAAPRGTEDQARKFYGEILGFQEIEKPEELRKRGGVWFAFGNYQVHIGIDEPFSPAKKAHPAFEVEGLEDLMKHLGENNVEYIEDDKLPGANRIYVHDPYGNRIEILEWL